MANIARLASEAHLRMVTLADVAQLAGVTPATVSNVMRGRGKVGSATRERVLAAAQSLGYRPNLMARALVEGRPATIALMVSSIANPFYPEFALEVERAARRHGYYLLVCNTNDDRERERAYLDAVGGALASGVIVMTADFVDSAELGALRQRGTPVVLGMWERPQDPPTIPCVAVDMERAGVLAAEHLLKLGHRHFGAIVGSVPEGNHRWRLQGFVQALARAGIELPAAQVRHGPDTIDAGRSAAHGMLAAAPDITAVFASNDLPAMGVLQAAVDLGIDVPADLSVVGVTDIQLAHQMRPALTTIAVPAAEAAALCVELLLEEIRVRHQDPAPMRVAPAPRLQVRSSTAKARR